MVVRLKPGRVLATAALVFGLSIPSACRSPNADRYPAPAAPEAPAVEPEVGDSTAERVMADSIARAREDSIARNPVLTLEHDGRSRRAEVHLPPRKDTVAAYPVVLAFHGGGGSASGFRDYIGLDSLADVAGFIAVYPDGSGPRSDSLLTWNAGGCCGFASDEQVDDVGFVLELLDEMSDRWPIDAGRVYATGLSSGAMLTYRLASEAPARFAAIAPVAGVGHAPPPPSGLPMPLIHFHSVDDPLALYEGGLGPPFPLTDQRIDHPAVEPAIRQWASHNGCRSSPEVRVRIQPIEDQTSATQGATRITYQACARGSAVVLWRLNGAGHVWPGAGTLAIQRSLGPPSGIVDANVEMWAFFMKHRRGEPAGSKDSVEQDDQ